MAHDVFISHSSRDKTVADAVCATLESAGIRCWIAPRDVQPGRSFAGEITRAIQQSEIMVLVFSAYSNDSDQVLREVQLAVNAHLHIIQFRIENVHLNDDLRYFLSTPHWLDALTPPLEVHIERLTASIKTLLTGATEPATPVARRVRPTRTERADTGLTTTGWLERASSRLRMQRHVVIASVLAALVILFIGIWWGLHSRQRRAIHLITQNTPAPSLSSTFPIQPGATQAPAFTPSSDAVAHAYQGWLVQPKVTPTVNPQIELPVQRRFTLEHETEVHDENFSPDGKFVATVASDRTLRLWDVQTGKIIRSIQTGDEVEKALFNPDARRILTYGSHIQMWDALSGKLISQKSLGGGVRAANFSPDGKRLVTLMSDGAIQVWDVETWAQIGKTMRHENPSEIQFSPDGTRILSIGQTGARLWNAQTGEQIGDTLRGAAKASFSPDGKTVVTAPQSYGKAVLWDASTGEKRFELDTMYAIYDLRFSPDGKYILTSSQDYTARIWDAATGKEHGQPLKHDAAVWMAIFSADTKRIATASMDETARLWDTETTQPLSKPLGQDNSRNRMRVHFSPDGNWLLTGSDDHGVRVWEIGGVMSSATSVPSPAVVQSTPASHPIAISANTPPPAVDQAFASALVQKLVNGISANETDLLVSLYDHRIDYLDKGLVGPDVIREEYNNFFERWPQTTWSLTGPVNVESTGQGKYRLTFPIYFNAANSALHKHASGNAQETIVVAQDGAREWKIISQRETILRSGRTRQQPVVAKPVSVSPAPSPDQTESLKKAEEIARQLRSWFPR
jgi:WD40 repeat protein